MAQWEQDLIRDVRLHNHLDDQDWLIDSLGFTVKNMNVEFTEANHAALQKAIDQCRLNGLEPKTFLEIGVCRNGDKSSTHTIIKNVPENGKYLGVDLEDKTYLNNVEKGIFTLRENSSNYDSVVNKLHEIGVETLDFIFIDGWHSINQVYQDWEYSKLLSPGGVIAFHDVTAHPGPALFVRNLDKNKWNVEENLCLDDFGFGYCYKKV